MPRSLLTALAVVIFMPLTAQAQSSALEGEWVGGFRIGEISGYLHFDVVSEGEQLRIVLASVYPSRPQGSALRDLARDGSVVRFVLALGTEVFAFEGQLQGDSLVGIVRSGVQEGSFDLVRTRSQAQYDPAFFGRYEGAYEIAPNQLIFVRRHDYLSPRAPYGFDRTRLFYMDESGNNRMLYPSSDSTFFAGPTTLIPTPIERTLAFVSNAEGEVIGVRWRDRGAPERFAPRATVYREEEVRFRNGDVELAGRLLVPEGRGPHPAIVLVHGWGARTRNTNYLIVADVFARHGIAALVYDKRGTGGSEGDWQQTSISDHADDALAAVRLLQGRSDINPRQVGIFTTSFGGLVTPLAASRSKDVAFLILMASPAISQAERYPYIMLPTLRALGWSEKELEEAVAFMKLEAEFLMTRSNWPKLREAIERARGTIWFPRTQTGEASATTEDHPFWESAQGNLTYDPRPALRQLTCPVLAIFGEFDEAVTVDPNRSVLERMLREGEHPDFTIRVLPDANHGMRLIAGPGVQSSRYAPGYFDTMISWLLERVEVNR
ncbi:MAG: alpha/beta hydrolase [Gemmatimonadetes bacterium]|nr:alpha/beta hydrolase [Gemmatimonadota bacterium]